MTDKKIKLDDILGGKWKNLPEEDRKFVEYVCLKKYAALRNHPDWCKTDDEKIKYIIGELLGHYGDVALIKDVLNRSFQGVTVFLDSDIEFLCEHPQNKPDLLYISSEENRTLTIEVASKADFKLKDGHLIIPSTLNADFVAVIENWTLYVASRDDNYLIGYEFDLMTMFWENK